MKKKDKISLCLGFVFVILSYAVFITTLQNIPRLDITSYSILGPIVAIEVGILSFVVIYWAWLIPIIVNKRYPKFKIGRWASFTIGIMAIIFLVGYVLIQFSFGEPKLSLLLRNADNPQEIIGNITCQDDTGKLLVGNEIHCMMAPSLSNISAIAKFRLDNGSIVNYYFSSLSFIAPPDVNWLQFKMSGYNQKEGINLEVSTTFEFETKEKAVDRQNKIVTYLILLLGAIFFSVPTMMVNLKSLNDVKSSNNKR